MNEIFPPPARIVWLTRWCFVVENKERRIPEMDDIEHDTLRRNKMNVRQIRVYRVKRPNIGDEVSFFVLENGQAYDPEVLELQETASPLLAVEFKTGNKILREQLLPFLESGSYVGPHCFKQKGEEPMRAFDPNQRKKPRRKKQSNPYTAKPRQQKRRTAHPALVISSPYVVPHSIPISEPKRAARIQDESICMPASNVLGLPSPNPSSLEVESPTVDGNKMTSNGLPMSSFLPVTPDIATDLFPALSNCIGLLPNNDGPEDCMDSITSTNADYVAATVNSCTLEIVCRPRGPNSN